MTPQEQLRVFLAMTLCGAALGAAYDALWLLRIALFRGKIALAAADLLFGLLCAAGMTAAALILETDAFRLYTLAGAASGMALYRASAGTALRLGVHLMGKMIKKRAARDRK